MVGTNKARGAQSKPADNNNQNDLRKALAKRVEDEVIALASTPLDAPDRFIKLSNLASAIVYRFECQETSLNNLLEALEYAKQALDLCSESYVHNDDVVFDDASLIFNDPFDNHGSISYTIETICKHLYLDTHNSRWLDEGIRHGEKSVDFLRKHQASYPSLVWQALMGFRTDLLADFYAARYDDLDSDIGGVERDIELASVNQIASIGFARTPSELYERIFRFYEMMVIGAGVTNDVKHIDSAVLLAGRYSKATMDFQNPENQYELNHYYEYVMLLCRRWAMTRTNENFEQMIEESRGMVQREIESEAPRPYLTDPTDDKAVLRMCAYNLVKTVGQEGLRWKSHLPTIDTAIALMLELLGRISMQTQNDLEERDDLLNAAHWLMSKRHEITNSPAHGFALDDMEFRRVQNAICLERTRKSSATSVEMRSWREVRGESIVWQKRVYVLDKPIPPVHPPRLMFFESITTENWIRRRHDDGTVELGAGEEDIDILEFLQANEERIRRMGGGVVTAVPGESL